jgi:excinuclease ABC subunit C
VFSIVSDESAAYVNFYKSHMVLYPLTYWIKKKLEETDAELLELAIIELRERFQLLSREVIVPFPVGEHLKVTVPQLEIKANFRSFCSKC